MAGRLYIPILVVLFAGVSFLAIWFVGGSGPDERLALVERRRSPEASPRTEPDAVVQDPSPRRKLMSDGKAADDVPESSVIGSVVDETGAPVAGATVGLKIGASSVEQLGWTEDPRRPLEWDDVTTDAGGRFRFDGLPADARFSIDVDADGFNRGHRVFLSVARHVLDVGPLLLEPGIALHGIVVEAAGAPLAGATVEFQRNGNGEKVATGPDGRFVLPPLKPPIQVRASATGFTQPPPQWRVFGADAAASGIRILLVPSGSIDGVVVDQADVPVSGVKLSATVGPAWCCDYREATSGPDGRFTIRDLPLDEPVTVDANSPRCFQSLDAATARAGDKGLRIVLERVPAVHLWLHDAASGAPVTADHLSTASWYKDPGTNIADEEMLSDATDYFWSRGDDDRERTIEEPAAGELVVPTPNSYNPAERPFWFAVLVEAAGYRQAITPILRVGPDWSDASVQLVMEQAGVVTGTVVGPDGAPVAGAIVALLRVMKPREAAFTDWHRVLVRDDNDPLSDVRTAANGTFSLFARAPRNYRLRVHTRSFAVAQTGAFAAGPDQSVIGLTVGLSAGGSLAGTVVGIDGQPVPGSMVVASLPDGRANSASTDGTGSYRIAPLPAGLHRVEIGVRGQPSPEGDRLVSGRPVPPPDLSLFTVPVISGQETSWDIDLRHTPNGGILGTASVNGFPAWGFEVDADRLNRSSTGTPWTISELLATPLQLEEDGSFRLLALPEGTYDVRLMHESLEIAAQTAAVVKGRAAIVRFDVETRSFRGRILDEDTGQPVSVLVELHRSSYGKGRIETQSGPDGRFEFEQLPADVYRARFAHSFTIASREAVTRMFDLTTHGLADQVVRIPAYAISRFTLPDDLADGVRIDAVIHHALTDRTLSPAEDDPRAFHITKILPFEQNLVLRLSLNGEPREIVVPFTVDPLMDDDWHLSLRIRAALGTAGLLRTTD